jgi:5-methylcytosine-specific restriction endonuclease McrA
MTLLAREVVEIVAEYEDRFIHTVKESFKMPCVIRLLKWAKGKVKLARFSRDNIYRRDGGICQYCAKPLPRESITFDHVTPRSQGGKTNWTNIVISCVDCNQRKGGKTPEQAGMKLIKAPHQPTKAIGAKLWGRLPASLPDDWKAYLADAAYWHTKLEE